ncbi:MAG: tRNA glutamyl-Q(34) synthetase GluQRS [Planctomycetota bacterium]|nr:tRNA glutamyl-Q(34) synthetase GluQRS [Planctomycetota bacterium]MDA1114452.1 tRNA glutamyl-Q(34) synthetase GluQRS [Planctomycetota bacterium]
MSGVVGRLAPSPTGVLHLGNARSFLLAWLSVRAQGGQLLMRIEDLDGPRIRKGAEQECLQDLEWLGLDWDGPLVRQSERASHYDEALDRLLQQGQAYACTCSRKEVELAASAPHAGEEGPVYPGTCRNKNLPRETAEAAFRFLVPAGEVTFQDGLCGSCSVEVTKDLGDFVIYKRDGEAAYQLAVVVDDVAMGVTEVLRGDDLLTSAARQLQVGEALGYTMPRYVHVPLVVGEDGRRLAKRHGDTSLRAFREQGVSAETILGWLAWSCGLQNDASPCRAAELIDDFHIAKLPPKQVVWNGDLKAPMSWRG